MPKLCVTAGLSSVEWMKSVENTLLKTLVTSLAKRIGWAIKARGRFWARNDTQDQYYVFVAHDIQPDGYS